MKSGAIEKELMRIRKKEERMSAKAADRDNPLWKAKMEEKIPDKVIVGLEKMFCRAFSLIFENGNRLIEKTYDKESFRKDFKIRDYALDLKGGRREIRNMKRDAARGNSLNMAFSAAEGIVLGALGIGLPDVAVWVSVLLRGVYETALKYGYDYESPGEKMFILMMLETSMSSGADWNELNTEVDDFIERETVSEPTEEEIRRQIRAAADTFAADMLVMKFIQGLPVIGIAGGVMNPVYYNRIMSYVQLKYRKRYLKSKLKTL